MREADGRVVPAGALPRAVLALCLCLGGGLPAGARQVYQLGGQGGRAWAVVGMLSFADCERVPGALRPVEAQPGQNLAVSIGQRGGSLHSTVDMYTLPADWLSTKDLMIDGDSTTAFVHPPRINILGGTGAYYTVPIYIDLGAPFPTELIRFRTRPDYPGNQIRQYELYTNDGSAATQSAVGDPIWLLRRRESDNLSRVVDLHLDLEPVRHIYLRPGRWGPGTPNTGLAETWEVAELEVFGRGFVPLATYETAPLDLGQPAALGVVRWAARRDPKASVVIQSRSGSDDQPEIYWRLTGVGDQVSHLGTDGRPLTRAAYLALPPAQRGGITDDLEHWSVWQTYELEEGAPGVRLRSPSPRRYVQFRIQFNSSGLDGGQIDSLSLEYSQPPVAAAVIGEMWPDAVQMGAPVGFTYAVRAYLGAQNQGFTGLELRTPAQVDSVTAVRIDRTPVPYTCTAGGTGANGFTVTFPRIRVDQTLLEVDFTARVFAYGTPFDGAVFDAEGDEVPLAVEAGDAVPARPEDALRVRTSLGGRLLGRVVASSPVCSPNGDGVHDAVLLRFELLRVTSPVPVRVEIVDLAGRRVRSVHQVAASSGLAEVAWNGRDDAGAVVAPGIYVFRVAISADAGEETGGGCVAVVY